MDFSIVHLSSEDCYSLIDEGVFDMLHHDTLNIEDIVDELTNIDTLAISVEGRTIGIFTLEDKGLFNGNRAVEVHAYILPSCRQHSLKALRKLRDWIINGSQYTTILTMVPDYCEPYRAVLERIGFKEFIHEDNLVTKDGVSYGCTHFYLTKL